MKHAPARPAVILRSFLWLAGGGVVTALLTGCPNESGPAPSSPGASSAAPKPADPPPPPPPPSGGGW